MNRRDGLLMTLTETVTTDESVLMNPDSPQGLAFLWLVEIDPAQVDPCSYEGVEQRFILATLYYATTTDGSSWEAAAGWLTEAPECDWMGVTCQNDQVTGIELRTYFFVVGSVVVSLCYIWLWLLFVLFPYSHSFSFYGCR